MPATATGRGAQVIIDPASDTAKAMRGAYAITFEANAAKVAADIAAGTVSSGNRPDGTTSTGAAASDPDINPSTATDVFAGGISFSGTASSTTDLSHHINLSGGNVGFNVSGGNLNHNAASGTAHAFLVGGGMYCYMNAQGVTISAGLLSFAPLPGNYANDAAAAAGSVPVGGTYRNGSVLMVRAV